MAQTIELVGTTQGAIVLPGASPFDFTTTRPSAQPGDLLLTSIYSRNAVDSVPSGWTLVRSDIDTASAFTLYTYRKFVGSSEASTYTWSVTAQDNVGWTVAAFRNVDRGTPVDVSGGQANANSTSATAPSVTTVTADTVLVGVFAGDGASGVETAAVSWTPPGGMTELVDQGESGAISPKRAITCAYEARSATGATGTRVATASEPVVNVGQLIALRPGRKWARWGAIPIGPNSAQ